MPVQISAVTHVGLVRKTNEDSLGIAGWMPAADSPPVVSFVVESEKPVMVVVADGMGGHPAGDVASKLVVQQLLANATRGTTPSELSTLIIEADLALYSYAAVHPETVAMGTTLAGIVAMPGRVLVFNVGDSSVFGIADGYVRVLSNEDRGRRLPGQPEDSTVRTVTQCLGGSATPRQIQPHIFEIDVQRGDGFFICSDGVTDVLDVAEFLQAELHRAPETGLLALLRERVLAGGAPDNLTAVLVRVV